MNEQLIKSVTKLLSEADEDSVVLSKDERGITITVPHKKRIVVNGKAYAITEAELDELVARKFSDELVAKNTVTVGDAE